MINSFRKEYFFLSNFYDAPAQYGSVIYPTSEHAFQAAKTLNPMQRIAIKRTSTPDQAKYKGRRVELRSDWEEMKDAIMEEIVRSKFSDSALAERLKATGDEELVEGNYWHDNYWGNCTCSKCAAIKGQNKLGKILMKIRSELNER